ncbi:hypothetical protein Clacol_004037 [Clathrus columnatus]|uniref:PCI domain-containing protein n=1 Tax=Clathrus columnatus TaxID=1419009 RepID=A0AAV5A8M8_9AGAM|nr:hypothetical protein Clacol_004037 [Clathrus columnatus]
MTVQLLATAPILNFFHSSAMESSPSFLKRQFSQKKAAVSLLIPPKMLNRSRSFSSTSRPPTPASSIPPSLPHSPTTSSQSSHSSAISQPAFHQTVPIIASYLEAPELLNLLSVSSTCRDKLAWKAFENYLRSNSWDVNALSRRAHPRKEHKSRVWLSLARSAIQKERILPLYDHLPKQTTVEVPAMDKRIKKYVEKLLRTLLDVVTEHDNRNLTKLEAVAKARDLSFIQFVARIPAYNWKLRYIKTFVVAAYVHAQTSYIKNEDDLAALAETLNFDNDGSPLLSATHANFIYIYGCFAESQPPVFPITSYDYDTPHLTIPHGHGIKMPGVRQAIERFKTARLKLQGFYRKSSGEISPMKIDIEPQGLASKHTLPFLDRTLITMNATVTDGTSTWRMEGSIDQDTGTGTLKSGVTYKLWVTPWAIIGEKTHTESSKHLVSVLKIHFTRDCDECHKTRKNASPSHSLKTKQQFIMSTEPKKQERDFTPEVDALLPVVEAAAKVALKTGNLNDAIEKILVLEKQTRNASDPKSTTRLAERLLTLTHEAKNYKLLTTNLILLSKKHGQLKAVIQAIVELSMTWLDVIQQEQGLETWLSVIHALRDVTEGKIFLETPRARVTLYLAHYHESLAASSSTPKESLQTASDLLSELQVETYSSMERREKTEFLLEQMRLLVGVAKLKDEEAEKAKKDRETNEESSSSAFVDGETEWVKVRVGGRKVNEAFLKEKENEDLKLKYCDLMIQYALHQTAYLDVAKHYYKIWETPSIKEDEANKGRQCFTTRELMRWSGIESIYGSTLRSTTVFGSGGEKRWEDFHTRVIEHNIRVIAHYYTKIQLPRLQVLLDLSPEQTEEILSRLVVSGSIWARIDRPAGIVNFEQKRSAEDVMNAWSSDMNKLLSLVEKSWMGMNAAFAAQARS